MRASLVTDWLDEFHSYSVFKCISVIGRCVVKMHILAPKISALKMSSKKQNGDFLENGSNDFN
jgi:hypothetical protein